MTSEAIRLLFLGTLMLGAIAFASCVALVVHHASSEALRRRHERLAEEALMLLAVAIIDGDELAGMAQLAVRRFGREPVAEVLRRARNDIAGERSAAITLALETIGEVAALRRLARSRRASRRRDAVRRLAECGGDAAREALRDALADHEWEVRRAARDGLLADAREPSIQAAVESYLAEDGSNLGWKRAFYARFALVAPEQLCAFLRRAALDASEEKLAIEALGHARSEAAIPEVRLRLEAADPELRASAARFAGKLCDHASAAALVRLLADPEWFVRSAAARGLENLPKGPDALTALGASLEDATWWVRSNAARTLARAGEAGVRVLNRAIEGDDAYARDAARAALAAHATGRATTAPPSVAPSALPREWEAIL